MARRNDVEGQKAYQKAYRAAHKERMADMNRAWRMRRDYGITMDQWDEMFASQHGRCGICWHENRRLVVDHDHATNKIRGLLCNPCNAALGVFRDGELFPVANRWVSA